MNIERKFKLSDNLYNYLMEKRAEAGIAIASDQVDKSVVDRWACQLEAQAGSTGQELVLGGAFALGLLLPIGVHPDPRSSSGTGSTTSMS